MPNPEGTEYLPAFASRWLAQWRVAAAGLEALHRRELREMTEAEAARIFALLDPVRPYELRPSSGLVEQQRYFRLLHPMTQREEGRGHDRHETKERPIVP